MIFMHKSAMQLQQQQQEQLQRMQQHQQEQAAITAAQSQSQSGEHHGLTRVGSASPNGSEIASFPKPHQCHQCLKSFSSNHQLVQHLRVHTGEKPYKCSYCERRFKQLSHVQQHTRLHTGERPYKCHVQDCGRAFIQLSNLQQHLRNHDAQLERSKNRPFHCSICGKGFATESSLRTHTTKVCKDQVSQTGGPNNVSCPICHKFAVSGEALMEHMKHTHKDPNASGVATKRRTANHLCPVCGKHYVNEGSLRKHMTCHPETAQLTSSLRMWPCSVCQAVFTHDTGLLSHMQQMRMDPKHQFAAQYVLSRAAAERRDRENILASAGVQIPGAYAAFGISSQGQPIMPPVSMAHSPSGSESSGRLSSPLTSNSVSILQQTRMSSPTNNDPLDARINSNSNNTAIIPTTANQLNNHNIGDSGPSQQPHAMRRKDYDSPKYESYERISPQALHFEANSVNMPVLSRDHIHSTNHPGNSHPHNIHHHMDNGRFQVAEQAAMKMAALLGQVHGYGHSVATQNDLRHLFQHQANSQGHGQDMMTSIQAETFLRSQAAEALRIAVSNVDRSGSGSMVANSGNSSSNSGSGVNIGTENNIGNSLTQAEVNELHHRGISAHNGHHPSLNQLNSILNQQDLSEALLRQLDARYPIPAHNA